MDGVGEMDIWRTEITRDKGNNDSRCNGFCLKLPEELVADFIQQVIINLRKVERLAGSEGGEPLKAITVRIDEYNGVTMLLLAYPVRIESIEKLALNLNVLFGPACTSNFLDIAMRGQ